MKKLLLTALIITIAVLYFAVSAPKAQAGGLSGAIKSKMNYLIERQGIISSNIANASTPDFIAQDIEYTSKPSMSKKVKAYKTNSKHFTLSNGATSRYKRIEDKTFIRNDGNSVRADHQMFNLANVQQEYTLATRLYSKHMGMQKLLVQK